MKRIRIKAGMAGLVFNNGDYKRVLTKGTYWLKWGDKVVVYDLALSFSTNIAQLKMLLSNEKLVSMWHVVEVLDNEIMLLFKNNRYSQVLTTGRYIFWKGLIEYRFTRVDLSKIYITETIEASLFSKFEISKYIRVFEVGAFEKAVLLVNDKYVKTLTGGTYRFWQNDTKIKIVKVDVRQLQLEIAGQELLTRDKANIRMTLFAHFKILNVERALLENKDFEKQFYVALQLALRIYVGMYTLDELLENKESLGKAVLAESKETALKLGVDLLSVGVRDVILTGEMKEIMSKVLIAHKTAQANVITRREETASTRSLLNTAKLMEDNEMLYKLKEMEYVEKIAEKIGEITVTGNGGVVGQLKEIFAAGK